MSKLKRKRVSIIARLRNYFFAGVVVLVPLGFTVYLTIFLISISSKLVPEEINPNNYLPFSIPGLEIVLSIFELITVPVTVLLFNASVLMIFPYPRKSFFH